MVTKEKEGWLWLLPLTIVTLLWEIVATYVIRNPLILPRLSSVIFSIYVLRDFLVLDILTSLLHFGIGMALAFFIAVPCGMCMGWYKGIFKMADPIIEILRPIPPLAWIPLAIIWFHLSHVAAGFIIFIGAFFPILIDTYAGFRDVPKVLIEAGKVLGCDSDKKLIKHIAIPHALPSVATGTRVGMGVGWMCVVAAEMFGVSSSGLGFRLFQKFYYLHQMDYVVAYMLVLGLISLCLDRAFRHCIEERLFRWKRGIVK